MPQARDDPLIEAVNRMNQRGGRMLSIVDLLKAGTVTCELAAHLVSLQVKGQSILSGAKVGGMGKTTLLAAVLAFTPPGTDLIAVDGFGPRRAGGHAALRGGPHGARPNTIYLCHEISPGFYYSYLWGEDIGLYFRMADSPDRFLAFTIHADSPTEALPQIANRSTGLDETSFGRLDTLMFINGVERGGELSRRVTALFRRDDTASGHLPSFLWVGEEGRIERTGHYRPAGGEDEYASFILDMARRNVAALESVRQAFLAEFRGNFPVK